MMMMMMMMRHERRKQKRIRIGFIASDIDILINDVKQNRHVEQ